MYKYEIEGTFLLEKLENNNIKPVQLVENLLSKYSSSHCKKILGYIRKKLDKNDVNYNMLVLPNDIIKKMKIDYSKKLVQNHKELIAIDKIKHINCIDNLANQTLYKTGVGLAGLTGRRCSEIFGTGFFTIYDVKMNLLKFSGCIKGKNNAVKSVIIPCLNNVKIFMKQWSRFVKNINLLYDYKSINNHQEHIKWFESNFETIKRGCIKINNRASKDLSLIVKKELGNKFTFKDLRAIYIALAIKFYKPDNVSQAYYTSNILGHSENDLQTQNSYMKYRII